MSAEQGLLEDIIANPDDDVVRLIYADWLEDHGNPARAEFIRTQIELARLPEDDPRRDALELREAELLGAHPGGWLGPLAGKLSNEAFQRGFLIGIAAEASVLLSEGDRLLAGHPILSAEIYDTHNQASQLAACPFLSRLQHLGLYELDSSEISAILASPHLSGLVQLRLRNCPLDSHVLASLIAPGRRWRSLRVEQTTVGVAELEELTRAAALEPLEDLGLISCGLTDVGIEILASSLTSTALRALDLSENDICQGGGRALGGMKQLRQLQRLKLDGNELGTEGVAALLRSPHLSELRQLSLSHNRLLSGRAVQALAEAACGERLTHLDLSGNRIGEEGARTFARSLRLARLQELNLSGNEIGDAGATALGNASHLGSLKRLDLKVNGLRVGGIKGLLAPGKLTRLRHLDLASNLLGDMGAQILARSPHLKELRTLNLHGNRIGTAGIKDLAQLATLPALRELDLSTNDIDDQAALALLASPLVRQLASLNLSRTDITPAAHPALRQLLTTAPRLKVWISETEGSEAERLALAGSFENRVHV